MQKKVFLVALVFSLLLLSTLSIVSAEQDNEKSESFFQKISNWFLSILGIGKEVQLSPDELWNGLSGYWNLDNNPNDISGSGYNGAWSGSSNYGSGKIDQAANLDGTNYISANISFDFSKDFTVSVWAKPNNVDAFYNSLWAAGADAINGLLLTHGGGGSVKSDNILYFLSAFCGSQWFDTGYRFTDTDWHNIVTQRVGNEFYFFVDSVKTPNVASTLGCQNPPQKFYIGHQVSAFSRYYRGNLDEVAVWNRAISDSEISQLYNNGDGFAYSGVTITCYLDSDCGVANTTKYCDGSSLCTTSASYQCNNPGTPQSTCTGGAGQSCTPCANGCDNGACLPAPNVTTCTDTDEGYNDTTTKGYVYGKLANGTSYNISDVCYGAVDNNLAERYCNAGLPEVRTGIVCSNICTGCTCSDGACVQQTVPNATCTDSDGGLNYYVRGQIEIKDSLGNIVASDWDDCDEEEFYCNENGTAGIVPLICPYGCSDGACVNQTIVSGCDLISNKVKEEIALKKSNGEKVVLNEGERVFRDEYVVVPGYLLKLYALANRTQGYVNDYVRFENALSGETFEAVLIEDGVGRLTVGDKVYDVMYSGKYEYPEEQYIIINFPQTSGDDIMSFENCKASPCLDLIERVKNPTDFELYGYDYRKSWNDSRDGTWWIDGKEEPYSEYVASWNVNTNNEDSSQYNYQYVNYDLVVFKNEGVNVTNILEQFVEYQICQIRYYQGNNKVYVCNWNVLDNEQSLDYNYESNSRQIMWFKDNVFVNVYLYQGRPLTNEEVIKISQKRLNQFVSDLQDNRNKYVEWNNFDVGYPVSDLIGETLGECRSSISDDICVPSWSCKIQPVVCPEYGYQTKTCIDYSCDKTIESRMSCSPGICSGCYVPRWFGDKYSDDICIPYGNRFTQDTGEFKILEKSYTTGGLEKHTENISIEEAERYGGDPHIEITSDNVLFLRVQGWDNVTYRLVDGDELNLLEILNLSLQSGGGEYLQFNFRVDKVYYDSENYLNSYFTYTFVVETVVRNYTYTYEVPVLWNMYCDTDGSVKLQKDKDYNGDWAQCQNNYECESNICSYGECVNTRALAEEAAGFKAFVVRVLCKLSNPISESDFEDCKSNYS